MIYKIKCRICNMEVESNVNYAATNKLIKHVKKCHNLTYTDYLLNGSDWPLCACGCGNKVLYFHGSFNKYYLDHKNRVKVSDEVKQKIKHGSAGFYNKVKNKIDLQLFKDMWEDYKNNPDTNVLKLQERSGYDGRTIKSYWWRFGIASKFEIERIARKHKAVYSNQKEKNGAYCAIDKDILDKIFEVLTEKRNKLTINKIKVMFGIPFSTHIIFKRLCENYGTENIKSLLKINNPGMVSKEEITFGCVLFFYFGVKNVVPQFKIKYINDNGRNATKHYDFCLFDKLIVEYDGEYWHNSSYAINNDAFKDELAIQHGYIIFRVNSKEANNIDILLKIKEIVDEIQTKSNSEN
ncbi:MAG: hypothetical protein PHF86_13315 [Candidatus Nanoarchaeia archaeon]|nr:hypothetical protein [Candidatus Nanoarchaeia archaeon]